MAARPLVEIVVALAASLIMALMVVGGGVAAAQMPAFEPVIPERTLPEPAPVSWNETR